MDLFSGLRLTCSLVMAGWKPWKDSRREFILNNLTEEENHYFNRKRKRDNPSADFVVLRWEQGVFRSLVKKGLMIEMRNVSVSGKSVGRLAAAYR